MIEPERIQNELRVLVVAPSDADAQRTQALLAEESIACTICADVAKACAMVPQGAGALVFTEEALAGTNLQLLTTMLDQQPPWSDLPLIILTKGGADSRLARYAVGALNNGIVLARPVRVATLVSSVRTALRARERQYQLRAYLHEREQASEERTQLYMAEQQARAAAEEAVQLRDSFLSIAAHELKTPLTSLLGNVQLIERRIAKNDEANDRDRRTIRVVRQQGQRLKQMIDALLDVSRLEQGQLSITQAPVDLGALAERVVQEVQLGAMQHAIECRLPPEPVVTLGDELRLEQVLQNLLQNAIKYNPDGGAIIVTVERQSGQAAIQVQDQGVGIPASALSHVFERFYRVPDAQQRHIQGTGIGLYVVKEIVTLHGGTVEAISQEGGGSTFTIRLPLFTQRDAPASTGNPLAAPTEAATQPQPSATNTHESQNANIGSILVVDDDAAIRIMLREVLEDQGYAVVSVSNGQEALRYLHESTRLPQLILLDLMMPVMDGWAFLNHQQQDSLLAPIPVVVISAGSTIQQSALHRMPASFLPKPVDINLLVTTVERHCYMDPADLRERTVVSNLLR